MLASSVNWGRRASPPLNYRSNSFSGFAAIAWPSSMPGSSPAPDSEENVKRMKGLYELKRCGHHQICRNEDVR
jgi:hypothetical protein